MRTNCSSIHFQVNELYKKIRVTLSIKTQIHVIRKNVVGIYISNYDIDNNDDDNNEGNYNNGYMMYYLTFAKTLQRIKIIGTLKIFQIKNS